MPTNQQVIETGASSGIERATPFGSRVGERQSWSGGEAMEWQRVTVADSRFVDCAIRSLLKIPSV